MNTITICTFLAALLYVGAGTAIIAAMKGKEGRASSLLRAPVAAALLLHAYAIEGEMFAPQAVHFFKSRSSIIPI